MNIPEMKTAVQRALGLTPDGIDGIKTWTAIYDKIVGPGRPANPPEIGHKLSLADVAESYLGRGIREIAGSASHPQIKEWIKTTEAQYPSVSGPIDDSTYPWCGVFAGHCAITLSLTPPSYYQSAKSWLNFGRAVSVSPGNESSQVKRGDVMVKKRTGGNHVSIVSRVGEDGVWCTGGNQSNAVSTVFYRWDEVTGFRRAA